jgi:hypothetical protein
METGTAVNVPLVAVLAGFFFVAVGVGIAVWVARLVVPPSYKKSFTEATAVCVDHSATSSSSRWGSVRVMLPVFEYEADGVVHQMSGYSRRNKVYTNIGVPAVGETRRVWINPENPRDAYVETSGSRFNPQFALMLLMSAAFAIGGAFTVFVMWGEVRLAPIPPVPFQPFGNFDGARFDFYATDGIFLMEIYEESLRAMLNDPSVSPLTRARDNNFLVPHYNPIELYVIRNIGNEIIYSNSAVQNATAYLHMEMGHGRGITFSAQYLELAAHEFIAGALLELRNLRDPITEAHFVLFDDPHLRYAPALFVWTSTPNDVFILWQPLDYLTAPTLFSHHEFTQLWQDFIPRN